MPHPVDGRGVNVQQEGVSVILPTIGRQTILASVMSAMAQSRSPLEIIVGVDSKFQIPTSVLEKMTAAALATNVRFVLLDHAGDGAAAVRSHCMAAAGGTYLGFLDDDDIWLPHHLESAMSLLEGHGDVVYCARAAKIGDKIWVEPDSDPSHVYPGVPKLSRWMYGSGQLWRRGALKAIPTPSVVLPTALALSVPVDQALHVTEDYAWLMDLETRGARIVQSPRVDVLCSFDIGRSEARHDAAQTLIFATHLERNSEGMGVRYLSHYAGRQFARRGRVDDIELIRRSITQVGHVSNRDQVILALFSKVAAGLSHSQVDWASRSTGA